jgi:hypothetical protein
MNDPSRTRAPVDRAAARRNYLTLCIASTFAMFALVVGYIVWAG